MLQIKKLNIRLPRITKEKAKELITCELAGQILFKNHEPGRSVCAPRELRPDNKPSFSYFTDTKGVSRWNDFGDTGGDVFALVAKALNCDFQEALMIVKALAAFRLHHEDDDTFLNSLEALGVGPISRDCLTPPAPKAATPPDFASKLARRGEAPVGLLESITTLRGLQHDRGLRLAIERGILRHCPDPFERSYGPDAYALTDDALLNANVRRLDGHPWWAGQKAIALPGSWAKWPVGIEDAKARPYILLIEGIDILAALTLLAETDETTVSDWGCVAITGTSCIHEQALPRFAGKHVRLVPHIDSNNAGQQAAARWLAQLESVGAKVSGFDLKPFLTSGGKDLNDAYRTNHNHLNNLFAI